MAVWQHKNEQFYFDEESLLPDEHRILEELYVDEKANIEGKFIIVPDVYIVELSEKEKNILRLPVTYKMGLSINTTTIYTNPKYGYELYFKNKRGEVDASAYSEGALLHVDGHEYLLSTMDYTLIENIKQWKKDSDIANVGVRGSVNLSERRKRLEQVKSIQDAAKKSKIELADKFFKNKIVTAPKIQVKVIDNGDASYSLQPMFSDENGILIDDINNFIQEDIERVIRPIEPVKRDKKEYILFSDEQIKTVERTKKIGNVNRDEIKNIISHLPQYFPEMYSYADKITGIGEYSDVPDLGIIKETQKWVPEGEIFGILLPADWEESEKVDIYGEIEKSKQSPILLYNQNIRMHDDGDKTFVENEIPELEASKMRTIVDKQWHSLKSEIKLKSYQESGVRYLQNLWYKGYSGALLADDMGLGKTLQTLVFASWVSEQSAGQDDLPIGIVAPVSLIKNWQEEYKKFIEPDIWGEPLILHGSTIREYKVNRRPKGIEDYLEPGSDIENISFLDVERIQKHKIVLTTYDTIRNYQLSLGVIHWRILILDEAQKIKNPKSRISMAVRGMNYDFALALTGTPVENSWIDLWTILSFCRNNTGISLDEFIKEYIKPLQECPEKIEYIGNRLKAQIHPLLLRRMKEDVLTELPKKEVHMVKEYMPEIQWNLYQSILARRSRSKDGIEPESMFKTIQQLRLTSLHPYYYKKEKSILSLGYEKVIEASARFKGLFKILDDIEKREEKVIIFLRDRKFQQVLRSILEAKYNIKVPPAINGMLAGPRRQEIVRQFNSAQGFKALILSAEAGGVGLNIIGANHVIHLSREWNPAKEDQATDRAYRIGQKKDVSVYYPLAIPDKLPAGSGFDEQLDALLEKKRSLSRKVIVPTELTHDEEQEFASCVLDSVHTYFEETESLTLEDLQECDEQLLVPIIEWCQMSIGNRVLQGSKGALGIDSIVYSERNDMLYLSIIVSVHARDEELEQIRARFRIDSNLVETIKEEYALTCKTSKVVVCFDDETKRKLVDTYKIGEKYIWGPDDIRSLLYQSEMRKSDLVAVLTPMTVV